MPAGLIQQIDVRTGMVVSACITLLLAVCLSLSLRHQSARAGRAATLWVRATALQPLGWMLYSQRGEWPDLLSIVGAHAAMLAAYALYVQALRKFAGDRGGGGLPFALAGLGVAATVLFTYAWPSVAARVVAVSPIAAALFATAATTVWRGAAPGASRTITTATFALGAVLLLARTAHDALLGPAPHTFTAVTPMQVATFAYAALMPVLASFGFVLMCNDRSQAELERLAATDPLTGALNRRMLQGLVDGLLADPRRGSRPVAALLVDADRFKELNDVHGHEAGDAALRALAELIGHLLRPGDHLGRVGGEKFLVALPATSASEAAGTAERIRGAVAGLSFATRGRRVTLSVSIGVAALDVGEDGDFEELLRRADGALHAAKRAGRNRVMLAGRAA